MDQYDKAIDLHKDNLLFLKSKQFNDAVSLENSLIARYYHFSKDMRQAEIYYLNSLESAKKANSLFYIILAYNNLGFFYSRSEEHTSELQSRPHLVCRLLLEKKKNT